MTIPVVLETTETIYCSDNTANFPNADVTLNSGILKLEGNDFVVNKSLTLGNGATLNLSNNGTLKIASGAKLYL